MGIFGIVTTALLVTVTIVDVYGANIPQVNQLYSTLMTDYNPRVRPVTDHAMQIVISVEFILASIQEFDEVLGKFTISGMFTVSWWDPRMMWNPLTNGFLTSISFPPDEVWTPSLTLQNPFYEVKHLDDNMNLVRFLFNGSVFWNTADVMSVMCTADMTYYPFDVQHCVIAVIPWGFLTSEVGCAVSNSTVGMQYYIENSAWIVSSGVISNITMGSFSKVEVTLTIERRSTFFVVNLICPIVILVFMDTLVFALPVESGERMSYSITVLLSVTVFLTLIGDNVPKTSRPVSLLSYFVLMNLTTCALICIITLVLMRIYHKAGPVPATIQIIVEYIRCRRRWVDKRISVTKVVPINDECNKNEELDDYETEAAKDRPVTWGLVSKTMDAVLFVVFMFVVIASNTVFLVYLINRGNPLA
jgi:hypothetical protein